MGKIFSQNTAAVICLLIALLCPVGSAVGAQLEADLFEKAYEYYLALNPEKAIETFDLFLKQFPDSSALDSVLFWRAKSLMQMKRIEDAVKGFRKLREAFPESSYAVFADKELDALKNLQKADTHDAVREKSVKTADAKIEIYEDRIKKLEAEKVDLEKQLADADKKRRLTEKGLSKALDDKNAIESQLDELKKSRDELVRRSETLEKETRESVRSGDEKRVLESKLGAGEEKIRALSAELVRSEEKIASVTVELTAKVQQAEKDAGRLDLRIKELGAQVLALEAAVKEKDIALAEARLTIASIKKSTIDSQAVKQQELEDLNQSIARHAAEKVLLMEEVAAQKKKAGDLITRLQASDEAMKKLLSDDEQRKASDSAVNERLKQNAAELAGLKGERDGLRSTIKNLEVSLTEKTALAAQAGEVNKLREEVLSGTVEIERIKRENRALLDEKRGLEARLVEDQERSRASLLKRDSETEKEKAALLAEFNAQGKKLHDAAAQVSQLLDERQKFDAALKERDQGLAKSREAITLLERTLKGSEQEKTRQLQELVDRNRTADREKKSLQDELAAEKRRVAELSGKVTEREAALIDEVKSLQRSRQDLQSKIAAEQGERRDEKRSLETERDNFRRRVEELDTQAAKARDASLQLKESLRKQEELARVVARSDEEIAKLRAEKAGLEGRLRDADKRQGDADLALKKVSDEKQVMEAQLKDRQNMLTKSVESVALLEKTLKGSEQDKARQLQELDTQAAKARDALSLQEELAKVAALSGREIAKLKAEKAGLEGNLRDAEEKVKTFSGIQQQDERIIAEKRALEQKLKEERARFDAETQKSRSERDELKKQLGVLEALRKDNEELAAKLEDTKRLYADARDRNAQAEKIAQGNRMLQDEKKQLEMRLRNSEEKAAALTTQRDRGAALESERKDLAVRLEDRGKELREQHSVVSRLMTEKVALEKELKEGKQELSAARAIRESRDQLQSEVAGLKKEQEHQQAEISEMKRIHERYAAKNAELSGEIAGLRMLVRDTEKPFLRIGKEQFTLAAVVREGMRAGNVTDKIGVKSVPWRPGNIVDDFIAEQILLRKAREEAFSADAKMKESLVKQYGLNEAESTYLDRYLAIDGLFKSRVKSPGAVERDAREYYDKHREQFVYGRENRVRVLSVKYGRTDELEKSIVAVEMQGEALEGKPFDAIAKKRSAIASMREMSLSKLPEWVRLKLVGLKEGEISNIISTDSEFMIIQAISSKTGYRSFEEARKEIEKKLSADHSGRKASLEDWLSAQKKEIEVLQ